MHAGHLEWLRRLVVYTFKLRRAFSYDGKKEILNIRVDLAQNAIVFASEWYTCEYE